MTWRLIIFVSLVAALLVAARSDRATPPTANHIEGTAYVNMADVCHQLGLRFEIPRNGASITLERGGRNGTLSNKSRDMLFDGVRVYLGDAVEEREGRIFVSRIDYERKLLPLWRPDLAGPPPRRPQIIVIDPGHGGWDPGTENKKLGLQEKTCTLDVALRLQPLLAAQGWTVMLTRSRDMALAGAKDADLDARSAIAARSRADVFLSIHFDANPTGTLQGSEIFSLAPAGQWASDDWNSRASPRPRGTAPGISDAPFPGNRQDLWNTVLAHNLFRHLPGMLHTHDLGERIAHWRVLEALNCPGVLVEPAYLSNDAEASRAASPEFRQHVAEALAAGLRDYSQEIGRLNATTAPIAVKN